MGDDHFVCGCPLTQNEIKVWMEDYVFHHDQLANVAMTYDEHHEEGRWGLGFFSEISHLSQPMCSHYMDHALKPLGESIVHVIKRVIFEEGSVIVGAFVIETHPGDNNQCKVSVKTYISH